MQTVVSVTTPSPVSLWIRNVPTFFSARSPVSEVQQFVYYAVTCSVAATPYRTPPLSPALSAFDGHRFTGILRGSVTEVSMAVI